MADNYVWSTILRMSDKERPADYSNRWNEIEKGTKRKSDMEWRNDCEKVTQISSAILQEPAGTFRSSWVKDIQLELEKAAEEAEVRDSRSMRNEQIRPREGEAEVQK